MRFLIFYTAIFAAYWVNVNSDGGCIQCNSATDVNCVTKPDAFLAKNCRDASSGCYTRIKENNVIRGCAEQDNVTLANCSNESECVLCSVSEGCNNKIFPADRLSCLQCTGNNATSPCASNILAEPTYCPIYKSGDKCYIWKDGRNKSDLIQRGCLSTVQSTGLCKNPKNCYTCEKSGCNHLPINSTEIPLFIRDSGITLGASLSLVLVGIVVSGFL